MNRAANGNVKITANNAAGSAGESDVANFTYNQAQFYQDVKAPNLISQSAQVTLMDTTGNLSGSRIIGDIQASSVEYTNILNLPTIVSESTQITYNDISSIPSGIHSSSYQVAASLLNANVNFNTGTIEMNQLNIDDRIRHKDDIDTSIVFQNNQIWVNAGGRSNIGFGTTETVINEDSEDHNFRVESNGNENAIFVDGGLNRVGILKNNPQSALDVNGSVRASFFYGDGSNLTNIPASSLPANLISSSTQVDFTEITNNSNIVSSSTQIDFTQITNTANIISSSTQITFNDISSLPSNILSSSTQVGNLLNVTVNQDRIYNASLTFTGSRYIRYTDSGNTSRYAMQFDGQNDTVKFMNRAANGSLDFFANGASAGSGGEVNVLTMNDDKITLRVPLTGSSYQGNADSATTASYVDMDNIDFSALTHYDDDTAAAAGGVPVGKLYRNGNFIQVRLS